MTSRYSKNLAPLPPHCFPFFNFEYVFIESLILGTGETLYLLSFTETRKDLQLLQWKLMKHKCSWSCQQETDGWRERSWMMTHLWSLSGGHSLIFVLGTSSREQHCGWFFWRKTGEEKNKWHTDNTTLKIMWLQVPFLSIISAQFCFGWEGLKYCMEIAWYI